MGEVVRIDAVRLGAYGWGARPSFICQGCGGLMGDTLHMSGPKKSYAGPFINPENRSCKRWELICRDCRQMYRVAKSIGRYRRKFRLSVRREFRKQMRLIVKRGDPREWFETWLLLTLHSSSGGGFRPKNER